MFTSLLFVFANHVFANSLIIPKILPFQEVKAGFANGSVPQQQDLTGYTFGACYLNEDKTLMLVTYGDMAQKGFTLAAATVDYSEDLKTKDVVVSDKTVEIAKQLAAGNFAYANPVSYSATEAIESYSYGNPYLGAYRLFNGALYSHVTTKVGQKNYDIFCILSVREP